MGATKRSEDCLDGLICAPAVRGPSAKPPSPVNLIATHIHLEHSATQLQHMRSGNTGLTY